MRTAALRKDLIVAQKRTVAYALVDIPGLPKEIISYSGEVVYTTEKKWLAKNPLGTVFAGLPANRSGKRPFDAEAKILAELRRRIAMNANAVGTVRIFVDQPDGKGVCEWCTEGIENFVKEFADRIGLSINANGGNVPNGDKPS